jgi:hypothetical protein
MVFRASGRPSAHWSPYRSRTYRPRDVRRRRTSAAGRKSLAGAIVLPEESGLEGPVAEGRSRRLPAVDAPPRPSFTYLVAMGYPGRQCSQLRAIT